jgi:pimeloyl-ACP methyl ester carboxylesterase
MSSFVLVHGGWHGGWTFSNIAQNLRAFGHKVFAPSLTGNGERSHLQSSTVNLDTHIRDVENLIRWEDIDNVILCGHSYGGMVITGVADRIPERIASLVYIDAYVPNDGDSCWSLTTDAFRSIFIEQIAADGFSCEPPADLLRRDSRFTAHSFASFRQRIRLSGRAQSVGRRGYAFAGKFEGTPFSSTYERCKTDPKWRVRNFPCGHNIMAAMPQELTQFLLEFSE